MPGKNAVRQKVGEADEYFPTCGGVGEAAVKAGVEHQILFGGVCDRPQVSYCIASQEWLSEVPDFSSHSKFSY